jgi:3-isopropylmalate dehydrogenase
VSIQIARIAHLAFKSAQNRRHKVTMVDKANVLETSRLWRRVVKTVSESYPDVALEFLFVDNAAMQIILNPRQFDVILTENLVIFYLTKQV